MQNNEPVEVEMTRNTTRDNRKTLVLLVITGFLLFALLGLGLVSFAGWKLYSILAEGHSQQTPLPSRQTTAEVVHAEVPTVEEADAEPASSSQSTPENAPERIGKSAPIGTVDLARSDDPIASDGTDIRLSNDLPALGPNVPESLERTESAIKYSWDTDSKLAYDFEIEAQLGSRKIGYRGRNTFQETGKPPKDLAAEHQLDADQRDVGTGSGFVIHPQGIVVTCAHVVKGATSIQALIGELSLDATVIKLDLANDLAVLRLDETGLPYLKLANSDHVRLGQEIRAIGYPLSDVLGESIKVTKGEVSGRGGPDGVDGLQLDATVNPGNSGGPLVDDSGRLVGVTSSLLSGAGISEVGFAIPSNKVIEIAKELGVPVDVDDLANPMPGPDIVDRVRPATVFLKVTTGPRGVGMVLPRELEYSGYWFETAVSNSGIFHPASTNNGHFSGKLLVDASGEMLDDSAEGMLPLMLGRACSVGIEMLPSTAPGRTVSSALVLIPLPDSQPRNSSLGPYEFGGYTSRSRPPWMRHPPPTSTTSKVLLGTESTTVVLGKILPDAIEVKKSYALRVNGESEDSLPLCVIGSGTGKFDPRSGRMLDMDYKMTITVNQDNVTLQIPVKMNYRLVAESVLAKERLASQQRKQARMQESSSTSKNSAFRSQPTTPSAAVEDPPFQSVKAVSESTNLNLFDPDQ
ncbi:putative serine protease HtrA [Novipirellula aureliae]|uniref:Putative serine protease HtrA n=1 Tax=Novipirellula aureliae TaxID=2527966 RepID=A0A5C6DT55_9BACT|nr:trypsin-like peptidase domain-containing protein [Novipirellula aureliae]TWU39900.1 putative serine protease HtrA [Novipirellula aureliae]